MICYFQTRYRNVFLLKASLPSGKWKELALVSGWISVKFAAWGQFKQSTSFIYKRRLIYGRYSRLSVIQISKHLVSGFQRSKQEMFTRQNRTKHWERVYEHWGCLSVSFQGTPIVDLPHSKTILHQGNHLTPGLSQFPSPDNGFVYRRLP